MFQMTFAVITPALIVGAYVERIKFSAVLWFSAIWIVLVCAGLSLDLGRRLAGRARCERLCRRAGRSRDGRGFSAGNREDAGRPPRVPLEITRRTTPA